MGRVSSNTDEKLIHAGVFLARKKGLKNFTVREVCSRSHVNLGMFHYYFKTRETFDAAVLKSLYGEMMSAIKLEILPSRTPRQNIEAVLRAIYLFAGKNRRLISMLIGDAFSGDRQIVRLVAQLFAQHVSVLMNELKRAQKLGQLRTQNARDALLFCCRRYRWRRGCWDWRSAWVKISRRSCTAKWCRWRGRPIPSAGRSLC